MDANSIRNMKSIIAVTNKHTAKLHQVGSLYILQLYIVDMHNFLGPYELDNICEKCCKRMMDRGFTVFTFPASGTAQHLR
jgi:hypothetical protein